MVQWKVKKVQKTRNEGCNLSGDHVKGHLDVQAQKTKITNVTESTIQALVGVTRGVAVRVGHTTNAPDQSKNGSSNGVAGTSDHERDQEGGVALEGVLVDTLLAVEDHLLLVLLGLGLFCVHGWQGDASLLAVGTDVVSEEGDKDGGDDGDGDGLLVLVVKEG